jgi:hypothetical protein
MIATLMPTTPSATLAKGTCFMARRLPQQSNDARKGIAELLNVS